jgi:hypothetical protein
VKVWPIPKKEFYSTRTNEKWECGIILNEACPKRSKR